MVDTTTLAGVEAASAENPNNPLQNDAAVAEFVSLILALKSIDPDLEAAYQAYVAGNKALVIANVKKSKFFQNFNATARQRAITKV